LDSIGVPLGVEVPLPMGATAWKYLIPFSAARPLTTCSLPRIQKGGLQDFKIPIFILNKTLENFNSIPPFSGILLRWS